MNRRGFLRLLVGGAATAVAAPVLPKKTFFSFFTGIFKPKLETDGAELEDSYLTLVDIAKRQPGDMALIVEMMNRQNEILSDMIFNGANLPTWGDEKEWGLKARYSSTRSHA